jgi:hypothetical protein
MMQLRGSMRLVSLSLALACVAPACAHPPEPAAPPEPVGLVTTTSGTVDAPPGAAPAPARVAFENRLPATYELVRVRMLVDRILSYDGLTAGALQVPSGDHAVQVIADYRLHDPVFSYVDGYRVQLETTGLVPESAVPETFVVTAVPRGGVTTPMGRRATLLWQKASAP